MKRIVFYSWQSDLPNQTNRGFIQQALEKAVTTIANDNTVSVEPVVDRDTQGVVGAPDIASTIFAKITASDIFVADVSIIASPKKGRPTPNPNVLIELGYALRGLGHERVILVFNRAFGKIEDLPFDLRTRRLMIYEMPLENSDRAQERSKLEKQLEEALRGALGHALEKEAEIIPVIMAIENNSPNKIIVLRRTLGELLKKINEGQPKKHSDGDTVEELIYSVNSTQESVAEFSKIVETISVIKDQESATEIYRWFGNIFERYNPQTADGPTSNADGDYFKFIGHEMFVTMIALYFRERQWGILKRILDELIPVRYIKDENSPGNVQWNYASKHLPLLIDESKNKNRPSIHSDILNARHESGGLSVIMPIDEFSAADFFLFLLGELQPIEYREGGLFAWRPWSILYMKHVPIFIKNAEQKQYAEQLAVVFNMPSINEMKKRLKERYSVVRNLFSGSRPYIPVSDNDIDKIATR